MRLPKPEHLKMDEPLPQVQTLELTKRFVFQQSTELNRLICQAVSRVTGVPDCNPYDFLKRMSKNDNHEGSTVYLDGVPILWVGKPQSSFEDYTVTVVTPYRILSPLELD